MPTRMIREGILTSERINILSPFAELFYRRLMSVVDDYGRYTANLTLLRASCYPLQLDSVKEDSIKKHLAECADAGLIVLFTVAGKAYLEMQDFNQRVQSKSKFPEPPELDKKSPNGTDEKPNLTVIHGDPPWKTALVGVEDEVKALSDKSDPSPPAETKEILDYLNLKTGRSYRAVPANLDLIRARLGDGATPSQCRAVIDLKTEQWAGDEKMQEYLRPGTLFNRTKFEQYLGQIGSHGPGDSAEDHFSRAI